MSLHCFSYPMCTNFTLLPSSKPTLFLSTLTKFASPEAPRRRIQLRISTDKDKKLAARSDDRQPVSQSESTLSKVEDDSHGGSGGGGGDGRNSGSDLGWLPAFPHVLAASMSNFLFGYHIGFLAVGKPILWITCYGEGFLLV